LTENVPKPFLKWAGGKGQILDKIDNVLPVHFKGYFEPFLGGGAVFFHLWRRGFRGKAFLSDLNEELIVAYETVRNSTEELIAQLADRIYKSDKETFYAIRAWDRQPDWAQVDPVKRTARMIYLNHTCFNGLYRVNRSGYFNVPFGGYRNPTICDAANLHAVNESLKNAKLQYVDFTKAVQQAERGDFIYLDPPYQPISETSSFTDYTTEPFGEEEQKLLAKVFRELHERGCSVLESNSSHGSILKLYRSRNFIIEFIKAKRAISCDPEGRGDIDELLIRNYRDTRQQRLT